MKIAKDTWIVMGILLAMIIGAMMFVYRGQGKRLEECKARVTAAEGTVNTQARTVAIFPELVKQVKSMRARYKNFDRRLPDRQELGGFLKELSGYLGDDNFSEQLIEPGSPTREDLFHTLPIIMRFKGSYLTSVDFFKRIDKMERLTRIQKLKITNKPSEDEQRDPILDIELQLNIYFTES
jgi:Tfp pilus assembly protein PilO|tara:strand:- start:32 stop:574 length:543 start_codon:yes stop_codon:yes gene_type:complete